MRIILLFLCCVLIANAHIYSSKPKITYNIDGRPLIYHLYMSLETGLGSTDYLQLVWPEVIHSGADKTKIQVKLITFSNNLQVSSTYVSVDGNNADSNYYIKFNYEMQADRWYEVQIFPTQNPTIPSSRLLQVYAKSSISNDAITYDSNLAFAYINVEQDLASAGGVNSLVIATSSASSEKFRPSSIYTIDIDITPTKSQAKGGNFTLELYYDATQPLHNSGTTLKDFSFMGLCQSKSAGVGLNAAVLNYCQISQDLSTITFSMNSVVAGQIIRISTQVKNPLYKSIRGIRGYWVEFVSGIVQQNGKVSQAVQVDVIPINDLGNNRIYLLWGIQSTYSDTDLTQVPLFKAQSLNPSIIPYNSFNIGFSFSSTSPIEGRYRVKITLQAQGILEGSLVHNFPAYENEKVFCHYETNQIHCQNVGAFINTNYRYFISGKAYFNYNTNPTLTTFGDIAVIPIVYDATGSQLSVSLYQNLAPGATINVKLSRSYLDLDGSKSYHTLSNFKIGNAQVISMKDDKTLSSTANAMKQFFTGTNNTVGVVPDLGSSQQLVFMLQTINSDIDAGGGNAYSMKLIYNNKVIGFENEDMASTRGLDFVGYENATGNWSISYSPCHQTGNVVCEKYNFDTPSKNKQVRINTTSSQNFYGMYKFSCGTAYLGSVTCGGACVDQCTMWRGWGDQNLGSSVMAMRKVTFPSNYYSSLYADENLLDFVIVFDQGGNTVTTGLINAYTVVGSKMTNIKASYVNYYDYSGNNNYNKGTRVPMMLRIGGGILPKESRNATVIGVFFDDNVQARTFYTKIDKSYQLGCSTESCLYYPNQNINLARNDNWHTNKRVQFYNIPPIQIQFNLLAPVIPNPLNHAQPRTLYIAFFNTNYTVGGVSGLLRTLSVYRLFGASVNQAVNGQISAINSLSRCCQLTSPNSDFSSPTITSGWISYALNVSNIVASPPNNTFTQGYSRGGLSYGTYFGAGVTITSLYYNIFASSTLSFESPPANSSATCVIFGYLYNQLVSGNQYRDKQWVYTAFCPIDSAMNLNSAAGNIKFLNPQYPNILTNGFPLNGILTYAYSDQRGHLYDYRHQTGSISSFQRSCTTSKSPQFMPSTAGKQRSTFSIVTPQIRMKGDGYDGYPRFRVQFSLPASTIGSSGFSLLSDCQISDPLLTCTYVAGNSSAYEKYFEVAYSGNDVYTITSFSLNLYATVSGAFSTAANYTVTIHLPQYNGAAAPFGHSSNSNAFSSRTTYCSCQSTFTVGITGRGTQMIFQNLKFLSQMQNVRSYLTFDFGASSYRQTFFSTSSFIFNFGFLTNPTSTYNSRGDFRCLVYQNSNGVLTLSRAWKTLSLSSLSSVALSPKQQITAPNSIKYTMKCYGAGVPTPGATNMSLIWNDNGANVQTATQLAPITYTASTLSAFSLDITYKRFRTQGFKAFYTFKIVAPATMDQNTRIYFDFHSKINSKLDKQGNVECYARINLAIVDSEAAFTYCQFITQRQLSVWNNQNLANGNTFYIDVYNIQQPKQSDITNNQKISCTIDLDDNYVNGANGYQQVNDNVNTLQPLTNTVNKITVLETTVDSSYIRTTQTITIKINMGTNGVFTSGKDIYLELPVSYAEWIKRSDTIDTVSGDCYFEATGTGSNLATSCAFISKRILKISVGSYTGQYYTVRIKNLKSPSYLPSGKNNQYHFNLFCTSSNAQNDITHYTFADFSNALTLVTDSTLIDLSWKFYGITQSAQLITLNTIQTQALTIYTGYYSSVVQLRQQNYPSNFQSSLLLTINNYNSTDFFTMNDNFQIYLGKSTSYFRIAAKSTLEPGLYSLQFDKGGDGDGQYTAIPPLSLVVNNKKCSLMSETNSYLMPVGGYTLPIVIKGINCIPIQQITISLTLNSTQVVIDNDLSSRKLNKKVKDGNLYIVLRHSGNLSVGSIVSGTFSITGPNAAQYNTIPSITITLVDPAAYQTIPVATALTSPTLSTNKASFRLQCSQASTIYWGLGIYPSILNTQALDFQARIISPGTGLTTNFTEQDDYYKRVYGISPVSTMQVLTKSLYNLKSNTNYIFKYFCRNQMGLISDSQSINFTSSNYGAYLMKVSITFRDSITYGQYHDLSCSLSQNFKIPYERVMTEAMSYCNNKPYIFYQNDSQLIANQADSSGQYIYNFYILPDYTISADTTNIDVRNALSLHSFTSTIITSTNNYLALPQLVQMQTQDIQVFSIPTLTIQSPIAGLNSVVITTAITNMNGFILVGVMNGTFDNTTMTLPPTTNIKKGLFQQSKPLLSTKMLYTTQNYNVTFQFNSLSDNKQYTLFYFATSQDPTLTATSSNVYTVNVKTLQALTVNINWEKKIMGSLLGVVLVFLFISM